MEMMRIRCTNCGAEFENVEEGQTLFRCTKKGCGCVFLVDQGEKFYNVEKLEASKIQKLRVQLKESLNNKDCIQTKIYAKRILEMLPGDFRAGAALALCHLTEGKAMTLFSFLKNHPPCTEAEFLEMFPHILFKAGYRELLALEENVGVRVSESEKKRCIDAINDRKKVLRRESDFYADIPRDVFICYSNIDAGTAEEVLQALEKDGNTCWISMRNLKPDAENYWQEIERAISRCRIFLVLCSEAAMLSPDVQHELTIAEGYDIERLELKLDSAKHTTQFHYFFDGISWVDAGRGTKHALSELKKRVFEIKNAAGNHSVKAKDEAAGKRNDQEFQAEGYKIKNEEKIDYSNKKDSFNNKTHSLGHEEKTSDYKRRPAGQILLMLALDLVLVLLFLSDSSDILYISEELILAVRGEYFIDIYAFLAAADVCVLIWKNHPVYAIFTTLPGLLLLLDIFIFHLYAMDKPFIMGEFYTQNHVYNRMIWMLVFMAAVILANLCIALKEKAGSGGKREL